jgi:hypothetical protein
MLQRQDYLKKLELKKQNKFKAGLVIDRFPQVAGIVIYMTYYHKADNPVLMERTVNVFPTSYAYFNMECMIKGCENGGFDLTRSISRQIKDHKKTAKGTMSCKGKNDDISSGHASISYEITIKYYRNNRSKKKK